MGLGVGASEIRMVPFRSELVLNPVWRCRTDSDHGPILQRQFRFVLPSGLNGLPANTNRIASAYNLVNHKLQMVDYCKKITV